MGGSLMWCTEYIPVAVVNRLFTFKTNNYDTIAATISLKKIKLCVCVAYCAYF